MVSIWISAATAIITAMANMVTMVSTAMVRSMVMAMDMDMDMEKKNKLVYLKTFTIFAVNYLWRV